MVLDFKNYFWIYWNPTEFSSSRSISSEWTLPTYNLLTVPISIFKIGVVLSLSLSSKF